MHERYFRVRSLKLRDVLTGGLNVLSCKVIYNSVLIDLHSEMYYDFWVVWSGGPAPGLRKFIQSLSRSMQDYVMLNVTLLY